MIAAADHNVFSIMKVNITITLEASHRVVDAIHMAEISLVIIIVM